MEGSEYMYATAEVGVALAGFAAIVIALRRREDSLYSDAYKLVVASLIERGLVAAFLSLLPILLFGLSLSASLVWFFSSGTFVLYGISMVIRAVRNRKIEAAVADLISGPLFYMLVFLGILVIALQFLHAFGIGLQQNAWWYLVAVTWLLVTVGYRFIIVLHGWIHAA